MTGLVWKKRIKNLEDAIADLKDKGWRKKH